MCFPCCRGIEGGFAGAPVSEAPRYAAGRAVGAAGNGQSRRCFPAPTVGSLLAQSTPTPADELLQRSSSCDGVETDFTPTVLRC